MKKRILCVAEHEEMFEVLTAMLSPRGYEVVTAPSPVTALTISCGQVFSLYVLDAQFWGETGVRLCRSIREFDPLTPVIIFSSAAGERARVEALEAGATCFVPQPNVLSLIEAVSQV